MLRFRSICCIAPHFAMSMMGGFKEADVFRSVNCLRRRPDQATFRSPIPTPTNALVSFCDTPRDVPRKTGGRHRVACCFPLTFPATSRFASAQRITGTLVVRPADSLFFALPRAAREKQVLRESPRKQHAATAGHDELVTVELIANR